MLVFLAQLAGTPGDCVLTGLCGVLSPERPVAPGVMYLASGLVLVGLWGLRRRPHAGD